MPSVYGTSCIQDLYGFSGVVDMRVSHVGWLTDNQSERQAVMSSRGDKQRRETATNAFCPRPIIQESQSGRPGKQSCWLPYPQMPVPSLHT